MHIDEKSVIWSADPSSNNDRPLLLMLHGYGSHEGDLFGISPYLPLEPVIAALRAPLDVGFGNAWFPLNAELIEAGLPAPLPDAAEATEAVLDWIDNAAAGVPSIGVLGFLRVVQWL